MIRKPIIMAFIINSFFSISVNRELAMNYSLDSKMIEYYDKFYNSTESSVELDNKKWNELYEEELSFNSMFFHSCIDDLWIFLYHKIFERIALS